MEEKLEALVRALTTKMNLTAERGFQILVEGNFVYGIANLVGLAIGMTVAAVLIYTGVWIGRKWLVRVSNSEKEGCIAFLTFCTGCVSLFVFLILWHQIHDSVMAIAVPEYLAVKEVMEAVAGRPQE